MEQFQTFAKQVRRHLLAVIITNDLAIIASWWVGHRYLDLSPLFLLVLLVVVALVATTIIVSMSSVIITRPTQLIAQAILHLSPDEGGVGAPDQNSTQLGKAMVGQLCNDIYRIGNVVQAVTTAQKTKLPDIKANFIADSLPLPLVVLNKKLEIIFANQAALDYFRISSEEITGKNMYSAMDMSFTTANTFDTWYSKTKNDAVTATQTWQRVRMKLNDQHTTVMFDLAAYYNKDNPSGMEILLTLFDHTREYAQDDQAINFVALAVHELRTPLTLLRGYIDVFEEELGGKVDPELADFLKKMEVSAQQLSAFVSNILNVARVDTDQLVFKLHKENWADVLNTAVENMRLRAQLHGIKLNVDIEPDLPAVGVDRVSISEVLINLLDNAIKYSGDSKQIDIKASATKEGFVETDIEDYGIGIPSSVMPNLFDKFYRSHRNVTQIGGTGLGLYLSKAIVAGHGGNIWVRSKEDEGSTFTFTVLPFTRLADEQKKQDNGDIVRSAHGWIKNHSLYRR